MKIIIQELIPDEHLLSSEMDEMEKKSLAVKEEQRACRAQIVRFQEVSLKILYAVPAIVRIYINMCTDLNWVRQHT